MRISDVHTREDKMIKIISKILRQRDKIQDSEIKIEIQIPEKTQEEIFDEAVQAVIDDMIYGCVKDKLVEACYTEEEIWDTTELLDKYGELPTVKQCEEYPKHQRLSPDGQRIVNFRDCHIGLEFRLHKFIRHAIKNSSAEKTQQELDAPGVQELIDKGILRDK